MKKTAFLVAMLVMMTGSAGAASLREVIRSCGDDGKKLCNGVKYGKPMQACLAKNKSELQPTCRQLVERLQQGEKVTLF